MLSYRHAFHAGNFADVLKHLVLVRILDHLVQKDKPFCCIDTHAGPGTYALNGEYAQKNKEFESGIAKLWDRNDLPSVVAEYVDTVKQLNPPGRLMRYPGSPWLMQHWLRAQDRLFLCELHPTEVETLQGFASKDNRIKFIFGDGFQECIGLLPPRERRGLILLDPSYEIKSDYPQVIDTLVSGYRRFATGIYALWYPVIDRARMQQFERMIQKSGIKRIHLFELGIRPDTTERGMTASGMIVVNPPWTLATEMQQALPYLAQALGENGAGHYRCQELAGE
jgi:23S rRNA (adenine2030-N6)-methyltransferase